MPSKQELIQMQSLPLEIKVMKTQARIREWVDFFGVDGVYVSFSGGKDSTVLLDICRKMYTDIKAVYVDTGLEYPEIKEFVKTYDNVEILRPEINFRDVIIEYGYPFISKEISECVAQGRKALVCDKYPYRLQKLRGTAKDHNGNKSLFNKEKYEPLLYTKFILCNQCCGIMKKKPFHGIKEKPIIGTLTEESALREQQWLKQGCNAFNSKKQVSNPMSFWTEQDILQYIKDNNLPIASVYGEIQETNNQGEQMLLGCGTRLRCSGCQRTGCIFCGFGAHLDTRQGGTCRYEMLRHTHPKLFDYCMRGGEFYEDGIWKPDKDKHGLGMAYVINELNKLYNKTLKDGTVKRFIDVDITDYIEQAITDGILPKDYK